MSGIPAKRLEEIPIGKTSNLKLKNPFQGEENTSPTKPWLLPSSLEFFLDFDENFNRF